MELDPEDFKQTFVETWAEWVREGKVSSIEIGFPAEVIDSLNTLGPPSWDLIEEAVEKLLKENRLEQAIQDLERLMDNEDSFRWPLSDPNYCLVLGMFRKFNEQFSPTCPKTNRARPGGGNWRNNLRPGLNECIAMAEPRPGCWCKRCRKVIHTPA